MYKYCKQFYHQLIKLAELWTPKLNAFDCVVQITLYSLMFGTDFRLFQKIAHLYIWYNKSFTNFNLNRVQVNKMQADQRLNRKCTLGYNHNKEVLMICLNKQCQTSRLCCLACIDEFHRKHQLISLHKFQQMLGQLDEKLKPTVKSNVVDIVRQYQVQVHKELDQSLNRVVEQYKQTKKQLINVFKQVFQMVQFEKLEKSVIDDFYYKFDSKTINFYLKKISQTKNKSYQTPESTLATIEKSQNILKAQVKDFQVGFTKLMEGFTKNISYMKNTLTQPTFVSQSCKFSKIHKAYCLENNDNQTTTKRFEGTGGYPINLMESALSKENNQVNIKILSQPLNKGIWIGVAIFDIVKNNNFLGCYGVGKGTYAIDQVGASHISAFSWNHHDTNYNSQPKVGWQFHQGDTVNIKINFTEKTVTFTKGMDQYTQPVRLDLGELYAFAGPTNLNDCLAIV